LTDSPFNPPDVESSLRTQLGDWAKRFERNPVADFGAKISIVSVKDHTIYAAFLRCLYDVRADPVDKMIAYKESAPPLVAEKTDVWALPVGLSRQFLEQEETVVAAEPGEVVDCTRCSGENGGGSCETCKGAKTVACDACSTAGRKSCPACAGEGAITCAMCKGAGKVLLSISKEGLRVEDVCPQCTGKKSLPCQDCADATISDCPKCSNTRLQTCPKCGGRGAPVCTLCGGSRKIVRGFSLQVAYKLAYYRSIVRDPAVPEALFPQDPPMGKLGDTILELEAGDAAELEAKRPAGPAGEAFAKVLSLVPAAGLGPNSRRILHSIAIEKVPAYEVVYGFEGKEYRAWVGRYESRVLALDDPFADLAGRWTTAAEGMLDRGELAAFEETLAKAETLAPRSPAAAALRAKAGELQRRAVVKFGAPAAAVLALAVPLLAATRYSSPNRFLPLAALGAAVLAASVAAVFALAARLKSGPLLAPGRRGAMGVGAALAGAILPAVLFVALGPIHFLDVREFDKKLSDFEARPLESFTADDDDALKTLIGDYAARGVDTSLAQNLLDQHAALVAAAQARALAEEQAAREEARKQRLLAALRAQAAREEAIQAAKEAAARRKAAALAAAKKKKKKKKKTPVRAPGN